LPEKYTEVQAGKSRKTLCGKRNGRMSIGQATRPSQADA
jgi:hypothetical protein